MLVVALAVSLLVSALNAAPPQTEAEKIEALIRHVESLADAKFIRNGVEHDAKTAGQFLRGKWKSQESSVKTAQDFIDKIATQSSTTGKAYLIKLKDGREVKSGEYLAAELRKRQADDN